MTDNGPGEGNEGAYSVSRGIKTSEWKSYLSSAMDRTTPVTRSPTKEYPKLKAVLIHTLSVKVENLTMLPEALPLQEPCLIQGTIPINYLSVSIFQYSCLEKLTVPIAPHRAII